MLRTIIAIAVIVFLTIIVRLYIVDQTRKIIRLEKHYADGSRVVEELKDYNNLLSGYAGEDYKADLYGYENNYDIIEYTGNSLLDALLSYKKYQAEKAGIKTDVIRTDMESSFYGVDATERGCHINWRLNETDTVALIFNLMDNAIEASSKCVQPFIHISIEVADCIKMIFENSKPSDINSDVTFSTSKKDKRAHGFGIEVVRELVEKYNGKAEFEDRIDTFAVTLEIPY